MRLKTILSLIILAVVLVSCIKDFDTINTNPQGFTNATDGALFNGVIKSLLPGWNEQFYINNEVLYGQTQLAALTQSAWGNYPLGTEDIWSNYYKIMPSVRELQKRFDSYQESPAVTNMKAILKITVAYKTFKVTDLFGDIPYSEAGFGYQDITLLHPRYDTQRDIYLSLLGDLKWAADSIKPDATSAEPFTTFSSFDLIFDGNLLMWQKLANSLRLRYALRMAEKEPEIAGGIIKEIIENNLPVLQGYDFTSPVLESASLVPIQNSVDLGISWTFREHKNLCMGSNSWHQFSTNDEPDGSGIFDPRVYIFFEGDENNSWKPFPQLPDANTPLATGTPYGSHRDDQSNYSVKNNVNYSPFNFFIIGDANYMPVILMTGAEVHFIKAEAYFRGIGVNMDKGEADNEYMNGMISSIEWWQAVSKKLQLPVSGLTFPQKITIPDNLNANSVMNQFGSWNATTEEQKLDFIRAQRWIDSFRQPWEAYAEARRTGATPHEGNSIAHYRFPYPQSEIQYNLGNCEQAKARQGGDSPEVKLWWIP